MQPFSSFVFELEDGIAAVGDTSRKKQRKTTQQQAAVARQAAEPPPAAALARPVVDADLSRQLDIMQQNSGVCVCLVE